MSVSVRPACYDRDERELIDVLQANLPYRRHALYFSWLYRQNPAGEAMAWIATDSNTGRIVGAAAAFPRVVYAGAAAARGFLLGDFCIQAQYRSLGLALSLQRACMEGISDAGADFAIDFPSRSMLAIYSRLKIPVTEAVVRHVKPLRADPQIERWMPVRALAHGVSAVANAYLRASDSFAKRTDDWRLASEQGPWGDEFTEATRKWMPSAAVSLARTADYLNWRYRQHPEQQYEMLTARRNRELGGYLVRHVEGSACTIDDLVASDASACAALLRETIARGRRHDIHAIHAPWPPNDPERRILESYGFRPRESSPAILFPFDRQAAREVGHSPALCRLSHGDWAI